MENKYNYNKGVKLVNFMFLVLFCLLVCLFVFSFNQGMMACMFNKGENCIAAGVWNV